MADNVDYDVSEFVKFYKAVGNIDVELKKQLRKAIMESTKPIVQDVRSTVLALPSKRSVTSTRKKKGETLGLRASIAAATKSEFDGNAKRGALVRIKVSGSRFQAVSGRYRTLPRYLEGRTKKVWRHPVFGNKEVWVSQNSKPYLFNTVLKYRDAVERSIAKAVDDTLQTIDNKVD